MTIALFVAWVTCAVVGCLLILGKAVLYVTFGGKKYERLHAQGLNPDFPDTFEKYLAKKTKLPQHEWEVFRLEDYHEFDKLLVPLPWIWKLSPWFLWAAVALFVLWLLKLVF